MWPEEGDTEQLLERAQRGDQQARDGLFERHRAALRRMIVPRLSPRIAGRVDASDVVQDVLLRAHRRIDGFLERRAVPFDLWLRQLAQDCLAELHRRHLGAARRRADREVPLRARRYAEETSVALASQLAAATRTPGARAMHAELAARFRDAAEELPDADREVLFLRHFEQLGNGDVARVLGVSEQAAGMRYLRALRRLRRILGEGEA